MFVPFFLSAQQKNMTQRPSATKSAVNDAAEEEIDPSDIETVVKEIVDKFKREKESDPVPVTLTMSYANRFTYFSECTGIEKDTKISIPWYMNVSESLSKLAKVKINIEVATFNNEEKQLEELNKIYKESVTKIIYLLEHPQKISGKK
jgi:hypothetical protein